MNESIPSSTQPPHAARKPRRWFVVRRTLLIWWELFRCRSCRTEDLNPMLCYGFMTRTGRRTSRGTSVLIKRKTRTAGKNKDAISIKPPRHRSLWMTRNSLLSGDGSCSVAPTEIIFDTMASSGALSGTGRRWDADVKLERVAGNSIGFYFPTLSQLTE